MVFHDAATLRRAQRRSWNQSDKYQFSISLNERDNVAPKHHPYTGKQKMVFSSRFRLTVVASSHCSPRKCIASANAGSQHCLHDAQRRSPALRIIPRVAIDHYATDDGSGAIGGNDVTMAIPAEIFSAYVGAGAVRSRHCRAYKLRWLHREFGIFGGSAADHLLALLAQRTFRWWSRCIPYCLDPIPTRCGVMRTILGTGAPCDRRGRPRSPADFQMVYRAPPHIINIIPHGAPDRPLSDTAPWKAKLGLGTGPTVMTFGLLSPGKGIETAIRAMPAVVERQPDLVYLIVGASHPALRRREGRGLSRIAGKTRRRTESGQTCPLRRPLPRRRGTSGLSPGDGRLSDPYPGRNQVTSGTLAYALAMGRPVVSTPYIHAEEALADDIGTLVPFGDSATMSDAISELLADPVALKEQSQRVWQAARKTIWEENARAVDDRSFGCQLEDARAVARRARRDSRGKGQACRNHGDHRRCRNRAALHHGCARPPPRLLHRRQCKGAHAGLRDGRGQCAGTRLSGAHLRLVYRAWLE